jgi:hypothetical protein
MTRLGDKAIRDSVIFNVIGEVIDLVDFTKIKPFQDQN